MFIGAAKVGTIDDWSPDPGSIVSWHASPTSLAKAQEAPISDVPISYMQAQHIRGFHDYAERGLDYSRLVIGSWDETGQCDLRAMSYVINAHLRRHDTYRSRFEYQDADHLIRRTIPNPADIKFVPTKHGEMTPAEWRSHVLSTPGPLQWDCFKFGIVQRDDHFTFYVIVDHVHTDPILMAVLYMEIHMMYGALVGGGAPLQLPAAERVRRLLHQTTRVHFSSDAGLAADSHLDRLCREQRRNPSGIPAAARRAYRSPVAATSMVVQLMDGQHTARFESACIESGARFIGGVFACAALAQYQLTGLQTYYGMTPTDMRRTPAEFMSTGWFTGMIPVSVPVAPTSFGDTARAAQASFDANVDLAKVPFDRVLELATWLKRPVRGFPMLSYLDAGLPPLSAVVASQLDGVNAGTYSDGRTPAHVCFWVGRLVRRDLGDRFLPQ